ncbi:hypothetical protein IW22_21285 [Chryseobacterium sp. JM1]|nr:hypothetical protein IW22_21285 [Chryseobacterium sp. JM1]
MNLALSPMEIKIFSKVNPNINPKIPRINESMSKAHILVQKPDKNKLFFILVLILEPESNEILPLA